MSIGRINRPGVVSSEAAHLEGLTPEAELNRGCPSCGAACNPDCHDAWHHESNEAWAEEMDLAIESWAMRERDDPRDDYATGTNGKEIAFYRCDGRLICWDCWRPYSQHDCDSHAYWLTVLCNGWRVKL